MATVKLLAKEGLTVVLTARDAQRGLEAVQKLNKEGIENIDFHVLDVGNTDSVSALAAWLKQTYGGIDILINNAAISGLGEDYEAAKNALDTNYGGVKRVTEGLLPILKASSAGARIVNVSSMAGQLENLKHPIWSKELLDADNLSKEKVEAFVQAYLQDVKEGKGEENKWPSQYPNYRIAKMAMNAYSRVLAKSLELKRPEGQKIYVNFVCPGFAKTDMNNNTGTSTPEEGADTVLWTALLPPGGPSGQFFKRRQPIAF